MPGKDKPGVPNDITKNTNITHAKKIKYRFEVTNPGNEVVHNSALYFAIPPDLSGQAITNLEISIPYNVSIDEVKNRTVNVLLKKLSPYETQIVNVSVSLKVSENDYLLESLIPPELTNPDKFVESDHQDIVLVASQLRSETTIKTAKKTFDWVRAHLKDSGYIANDRGALYALKNKEADCTEYMYLFGALLRANNIPVRMVSGFIVDSNKLLKSSDYHNWVEMYVDGKWRVVDPQKDKFMENESTYVVMRILQRNGVSNSVFNNAQQLVKVNGKAKVSML